MKDTNRSMIKEFPTQDQISDCLIWNATNIFNDTSDPLK